MIVLSESLKFKFVLFIESVFLLTCFIYDTLLFIKHSLFVIHRLLFSPLTNSIFHSVVFHLVSDSCMIVNDLIVLGYELFQ